ncbi:hypothetical protein D3C78_1389670 [compost metagenome]
MQAQLPSGGAGIKVASGDDFCIWCMTPGSVATMKVPVGWAFTWLSRAWVEPITSACSRTTSSHSGCASTTASGCRTLRATSLRAEKVSCTMQLPCHSTMSRPVFCISQRPRFLSGAKMMPWSLGMLLITRSALLEVRMMSESAFTSAVQLM